MGDILETGITELIGINEQVDTTEFSGSVAVALPHDRHRQGKIESVGFYLNGAAIAISPAGDLYFMDADPAVAVGAADLAAGEWLTIFGHVGLVNADVVSGATPTGGVAFYHDLDILFHLMDSMYLVFYLSSATSFNDVGGDDESLSVNVWYQPRF